MTLTHFSQLFVLFPQCAPKPFVCEGHMLGIFRNISQSQNQLLELCFRRKMLSYLVIKEGLRGTAVLQSAEFALHKT